MEPRIATLLGDSASLDRSTLDPISLLPPLPAAPRRSHTVEVPPVGDDATTTSTPRKEHGENHSQASIRQHITGSSNRQKAGAPIAEVLNDELPAPGPQPTAPPPFSGRLSDILLDSAHHHPNKRRKLDEQRDSPAVTATHNALPKRRTLPEPAIPQKKPSKRNMLPPMLHALHQPPPLPPQGRLIPPITGESSGFGREIGERVALRSAVDAEKARAKDTPGDISAPTTRPASRDKGEIPQARPAQGSDKENQGQEEDDVVDQEAKQGRSRKRNKWSEQETQDLLRGVSKFGIGNWKKILQCPEFAFNQRTTVDLKDRFRTCCPDQVKMRKAKNPSFNADTQTRSFDSSFASNATSQDEVPLQTNSSMEQPTPPPPPKNSRKPRGDSHKKSSAELEAMGIKEPFFKVSRRQRREFTEEDDENLLRGFRIHGPTWHAIRKDASLGFTERQPTDLRDRFRIRYPEKYEKEGYKLKRKEKKQAKDAEPSSQDSAGNTAANLFSESIRTAMDEQPLGATIEITRASGSSNPIFKMPHISSYETTSFPAPLGDSFIDSITDGQIGHSPITLNRDILEWIDANPAQAITSTGPTTLSTALNLSADLSLSFFPTLDTQHINPLATLQAAPTSSHTIAPPHQSNQSHTNTAAPPTAHPAFPKQAIDPLLRTPTIPALVFPQVPVASARSAMHNLPRPADLLSGLERENRQEVQVPALVLDDVMNLGLNTATLAPLMGAWNGGSGRGGLVVGEEGLERSVLNSKL